MKEKLALLYQCPAVLNAYRDTGVLRRERGCGYDRMLHLNRLAKAHGKFVVKDENVIVRMDSKPKYRGANLFT